MNTPLSWKCGKWKCIVRGHLERLLYLYVPTSIEIKGGKLKLPVKSHRQAMVPPVWGRRIFEHENVLLLSRPRKYWVVNWSAHCVWFGWSIVRRRRGHRIYFHLLLSSRDHGRLQRLSRKSFKLLPRYIVKSMGNVIKQYNTPLPVPQGFQHSYNLILIFN